MNRIKFNEPFLSGKELSYIQKAITSSHYSGNGTIHKVRNGFSFIRCKFSNGNFVKSWKDDKRSRNVYKNILFTLPIKGVNAFVSLAMVPLLYSYLEVETYGVWIILFTTFSWIGLFDLGLADGLKNRLIPAITDSNFKLAKEYISTAYYGIGFVSVAIFLIMLIPMILIMDWDSFLNHPNLDLNFTSISILFGFLFLIRFLLQLLLTVLIAYQDVYKAELINFISNLSVFLLLFTTVQLEYNNGSLLTVILIYMLTPIIVLLIFSSFYYAKRFENISPSFNSFSFKHLKSLLSLGLNFLWIRLNGIILLQSAYLIISSQIGPSEVAKYNIAFIYYNSIYMLLNVFINPYWPAVAESVKKQDYNWIRNSLKKVRIIFLLFATACFMLYALADILIPIWVNESITFDNNLLLFMCFYIMLNMWKEISSFFLNGMSELRIQSIVSSFTALKFFWFLPFF